jgi:putative membrane protein
MMYWGYGMGWAGMLAMILGYLVFWALVVGGIVMLVRYPGHSDQSAGPASTSPQQQLAERYARGEIDEEEYRRHLQILTGR